jgi:hypothetical protein
LREREREFERKGERGKSKTWRGKRENQIKREREK